MEFIRKAANYTLFGTEINDEWNYPRSYLTSDGNVVGISTTKFGLWIKMMNIELIKLEKYP